MTGTGIPSFPGNQPLFTLQLHGSAHLPGGLQAPLSKGAMCRGWGLGGRDHGQHVRCPELDFWSCMSSTSLISIPIFPLPVLLGISF